ncbi:MAG: sialate O-acetylesterase [Ruminococcaceae bacterium]|nr:sialate O-acetylesterase [Oscillospiraceae bacterium]
MKKALRLLALLLCAVTLFSACGNDKPAEITTEALTETPTREPLTPISPEDIQMPENLCDIIDTVHIERVTETPTFTPNQSLPEDTDRAVIIPHFTVNDHMVLQRRAVNLIRGRTSDAHVAAQFCGGIYYGQVENGYFEIYLPPMEAQVQKDLVILTDTARLTLTDICVGDVYLLSGQSNMAWSMGWSEDIHKNDIANATEENIRVMRMNHTESEYERMDAEGDVAWMRISPEVAKTFSAIGYLFGKRLHQELEIPIGLVQAAVSGSAIAFWFPADTYQAYVRSGGVAYTSNSSGNLMPCLGYNGMIAPLLGMRFCGMLWYQGEANTSDSEHYFDQLSLLINTYRERFNAPLMSVTVVELPKATPDHAEKWAPVKAAQQRAAAELENVALSISIDLGYEVDVHPRDKTVYARRAAEITLHRFYGLEISPFPSVAAAERITETIVSLTLTGGDGFELRNGINGFQVSTDGEKWFAIEQADIDGNVLTLVAAEPFRYIRYGVIYYPTLLDFSKHVTVYNTDGNPLDQFILQVD